MNDAFYGAVVVGVVVGLAIVVYAEAAHLGLEIVAVGGAVVIASVGLLAAAIARSGPEEEYEPPVDEG